MEIGRVREEGREGEIWREGEEESSPLTIDEPLEHISHSERRFRRRGGGD
jgi:hypothetical protein